MRSGLKHLTPQFRSRFLAPALSKLGCKRYDWQRLQDTRAGTRNHTLVAVQRARLWQLQTMQFSHSEFGPLLLDFVLLRIRTKNGTPRD